jgi:hypothetical protein
MYESNSLEKLHESKNKDKKARKEFSHKAEYDRKKREMKEVYNIRLKDAQAAIEGREGQRGTLQELNMLLITNTIKEFKGSKDLEYHFDIHTLRHFADNFI